MSTLSELVGAHTNLTPADINRLHSLVADWAMLADLSFADLLLCVQMEEGRDHLDDFLVVAQVRPATGPTVYAEDLVASTVRRWSLSTSLREGRIVREGDPEWQSGVPVRVEAIPVRSDGRIIAVLARDTNLSATRSPSALELAYLGTAGELVQMVAEGTFPFEAGFADSADAPRVGDGMIRLEGDGMIAYASPNAVSAYRRLGHNGNLVGDLSEVHQRLLGAAGAAAAGGAGTEIPAGLRFREVLRRPAPIDDEIERAGAVVLVRAIPLMPGDKRGAIVLVRDATELRRREAQLLSKDATIREIHHRVKNNLQTVAALLRMQARRMAVPEARMALRESVRRVTSIAVVHETLSQSMGEEVEFDTVADQLSALTVDVAATGSRATVSRQGSFGILPGTLATPLALVLSELLQNAVEHGAASSIRLGVVRHGQQLDVVVADDGRGLPPGFSLEQAHGLGLQIVRTLVVGEMRGTLAISPGAIGGTEAAVAIPNIDGPVI